MIRKLLHIPYCPINVKVFVISIKMFAFSFQPVIKIDFGVLHTYPYLLQNQNDHLSFRENETFVYRKTVSKGKITTQTAQRDKWYAYIGLIDNLCGILRKMVDYAGLHRPKIPESLFIVCCQLVSSDEWWSLILLSSPNNISSSWP